MNRLTIGGVASRADVNIETLRYYERRGLVARPPRSASNYRLYPPDTVRRVRFIKHAQALGFSLKEIKELLSLRAAPKARCGDVRDRTTRKISDIEDRMRALRRMKRVLAQLVAECEGGRAVSACPILEALDAEEDA